MNSKYEISIWSDVYDTELGHFVEQKEIVIGSNTMTSESRARNPKLINNINGTNKFSFDLYYKYIDTRTGEEIDNPYIPYLVNERKIKVLWKDQWYDMLVKRVNEKQAERIFSYECEDSYITELSRTGFELEFATELENNIGTAEYLIDKVIKNTDWRFDTTSPKIYQLTEEAVYEAIVFEGAQFEAIQCPNDIVTELDENYNILVYYSFAPDINNLKSNIYIRATSEQWQTDQNEMLVLNGDCFKLDVTWTINEEDNIAIANINQIPIFKIDFKNGISNRFRAERYVQSQKTAYCNILDRYVNVYHLKQEENDLSEPVVVYGYEATEYNDALAVVNLIANANNFKNLSGWTGGYLTWDIYPKFDGNTDITNYNSTSYLGLRANSAEAEEQDGIYFNSGIQNNRSYISKGFTKGEKYIFRIKAKRNLDGNYINEHSEFIPIIARSSNYKPDLSNKYFVVDKTGTNGNWLEYYMTCIQPASYDDLITATNSCGFFLQVVSGDYWIEDIQFFKEIFGENHIRINPNEMAIQSVSQQVWRYFMADQPAGTTKDNLEYYYDLDLVPVYNNYERYGTIEESQSNRFNILQSIAEAFQCWVRFKIDHNQETGEIEYDIIDGKSVPRKFIRLEKEAGQETGIGFIYGIDLKDVSRSIKSDQIATKTIVLQNENEFGKNGFCSIARSDQNYPRENVIYNFDYYIQHGLLDRNVIYHDLYDHTEDSLQYYFNLHEKNTEYAFNLEELLNKNNELTKQKAMATVYEQYIKAATEEESDIIDSLMKLSGSDSLTDADTYAKTHLRDTKVQTLFNDLAYVRKQIENYNYLFSSISESITRLKGRIAELEKSQNDTIEFLRNLNADFYKKYARFIQEGTWSSEDYWDDNLYYLDALQVAYTSSRPQISYEINVLRLSEIEDYSSKVFKLGDISFIQDTKYFGYLDDGITPYKEKVMLSEITSFFDTPDKDTIKVQNYKTQFDDLFQRITAATQSLEFSEGKYARAADIVQSDGTIKQSIIQNTFSSNYDLVYGAQNESVTMDNTGITVTNNSDASQLLKLTSGGVFVSADGGDTWKNAIRGDGINTELLTAGRINTENITIYDGEHPSFRWDPSGLNAFVFDKSGIQTKSFVRFDQYGVYGVVDKTSSEPGTWVPTSEQDVYNNASFGLTWNRFFMKNSDGTNSVEISTNNDIVIKNNGHELVKIGRIENNNYGLSVKKLEKENEITKEVSVFRCDKDGAQIAGWTINEDKLQSKLSNEDNRNITISADGSIGAYDNAERQFIEQSYKVITQHGFTCKNLITSDSEQISIGEEIYVFISSVGSLETEYQNDIKPAEPDPYIYPDPTMPGVWPKPKAIIQIVHNDINYQIENTTTEIEYLKTEVDTSGTIADQDIYHNTYSYFFGATIKQSDVVLFTIDSNTEIDYTQKKYIPKADTAWYIDKTGMAVFHYIEAYGGSIAGWYIDNECIYQTYDGSPDKVKNGQNNIKTQLNSAGLSDSSGKFDYNIITDAINAAIATVGGMLMQGGTINGINIEKLKRRVDDAYNYAGSAMKRADEAYTHVASHRHPLSFTSATVQDNTYLRPKAYTDYN